MSAKEVGLIVIFTFIAIGGFIFLLIGIRGPIQFLKQEKRSEERYQDKNS